MPIMTVWDNPEKTIIRKDFQDPWAWEDYEAALAQSHALMAEFPERKIAIILNLAESRHMPPNPLPRLREILRDGMPENWDGTIVVSSNLFFQSIVGILGQGLKTVHRHVETANSLKEARQTLAARQAKDACC
ncbi:MAG: hypothetical protein JXN59_07685 [Anaerolineae bacterium]|nr:hypothetical protein [Anaerolineae bacterium]